ncbi:hypothetical protein NLJ89_g9552 [Agrocybe chaxingu]|uniref:Uncharacterized protein n=1 Tax=Agrocybe chaxingu TaxID=84603 RepID=A0A9W8JTC8_9AGAR|nr:hypothetical protein NLJ89_g9552 [Agrocybe chaxingu]
MSKNPKYDTSSSRDVPGLYSSRQISKTTGTSSCLEYTSREGNSRPQSSRSAKHEVKEEGDEQAEEVTKATDAYAALCAVGMPEEVTREAFIRLYLSSDRTSLSGGKGKERKKETDHLHRKEKGKRRQVAAHEKDTTGGVPWKALIDTLAAQLVGRSEVARVRSILQASEGEGPHKDLSDRLASAHRILNATRREWEVERANLDALGLLFVNHTVLTMI